MVISGSDGACLLVSYRPLAPGARGQKTSQTSVVPVATTHESTFCSCLHEHRLFVGALSPHRPPEPCPRILL